MKRALPQFNVVLVAVCVMSMASGLRAQQMTAAELPNAPQAQQDGNAAQPPEQESQQATGATRLLPGFRSVSASLHLPPQTVKEKFSVATRDSFGFTGFAFAAVAAGEEDARRKTPEFGHGGVAYGRYLWHAFVDRSSENYFVEFIVPAATHEDTRYYRLGPGRGAMRRTGYALSRALVTRNDAGNETFNVSEVIGAGAAAGVSNLYYPSPERTFGNTASSWGTNVGVDAATFVVQEFWPDISRIFFHDKAPVANH